QRLDGGEVLPDLVVDEVELHDAVIAALHRVRSVVPLKDLYGRLRLGTVGPPFQVHRGFRHGGARPEEQRHQFPYPMGTTSSFFFLCIIVSSQIKPPRSGTAYPYILDSSA